MKKIITTLVITFFISCHCYAESREDTGKRALIDTLLEQTGQSATEMGTQFSNLFIQQMTTALKKSNSNIDPKAYTIMEEEVKAIITEEVVDGEALLKGIYPIYDKYFSNAELRKMIEINNTELGKKLIKVMPLIVQESIKEGQIYGQSLRPKIKQRILSRFEKEGIK